jgi:hypothetical protein
MNKFKISYEFNGEDGCGVASLLFGSFMVALSENMPYSADQLIDGKCPIATPSDDGRNLFGVRKSIEGSNNALKVLPTLLVCSDRGPF